jgi:hypothetical protein
LENQWWLLVAFFILGKVLHVVQDDGGDIGDVEVRTEIFGKVLRLRSGWRDEGMGRREERE